MYALTQASSPCRKAGEGPDPFGFRVDRVWGFERLGLGGFGVKSLGLRAPGA